MNGQSTGTRMTHVNPTQPNPNPPQTKQPAFPTPAEYATTNAECKAREVAARLFAEAEGNDGQRTLIVIGSDTMCVRGFGRWVRETGPYMLSHLPPVHTNHPAHRLPTFHPSVDRDRTILEKPDDAQHAFDMISSLQGRQHFVHSGVAVFSSKHPSSRSAGASAGGEGLVPVARFCETTRVTFCPMTEEEIWSYVRCVCVGVCVSGGGGSVLMGGWSDGLLLWCLWIH
jgi:predicted house-cleaning NTP pyrophosphatase (Maf/HAM1 superfamily)